MLKIFYKYRGKLASIFLILLVISFQSAFAQGTGSIKGTIIDRDTKEALTGANIIIKNTSLGAAADLNGKFFIYNVPEGTMQIVVSYIGYVPQTANISVESGKTVEVQYALVAEVLEGQEVVVTAQAVGQIEAINQQLSSNTIKNVVSEARIQELPDFNAAETIGRLPGVSTQRSSGEGNKVVIRGLSPKHNIIAINGLELGATGSNDRSVDLTMISPNMLQSIEVFKAITPDMDADAIGGYVNLQLREAESGLHTDLLWQSGYTKLSDKYNNYKAVGQVSNRFFDDNLGIYLLGNIEQVNRSSDNYNAAYDIQQDKIPAGDKYVPVVINNMGLNRHLETRKRYGANLVMDYKLPDGKLMLINFFSRLNSDYTNYNTNRDAANQNINYLVQKGNSNTDIITNALQGDNDFGFMSIDYSLSNNYSRNSDPDILSFNFRQETAFVKAQIPNAQPEVLVQNTVPDDSLEKTWLETPGRNTADYKENSQTFSFNLKVPFNLDQFSTSGFFKAGVRYRNIDRKNDQNAISARTFFGGDKELIDAIHAGLPGLEQDHDSQNRFYARDFISSDPSLWQNFLSNRFGDLKWVPDINKLLPVLSVLDNSGSQFWYSAATQLFQNDYSYKEKFSAGYGMAQLNIGSDITFVGGVRYENDDRTFKAYQFKDVTVGPGTRLSQPFKEVTAPGNNHYFLPMVHLRYKPFEWLDFRYAFTQTLSRPDFIALTPAYFINSQGNFTTAGNPNLKPAQSNNHDIVASVYNNEIGLFTLGGFYKVIHNFIWQTQYGLLAKPIPGFLGLSDFPGASGGQVQTYNNNKYIAEMYGVEFDWQTRFWYLPFPINGIVLNINYTHIWSETKYPRVFTPVINGRPQFVDTFRVGRVQDQPADIGNISFGYDLEGFSGRVSFLYQGSVISYAGRRDEVDSKTNDYFRIDVALRQKLPIDGLQIYLNLNNINQRKDEAAQKTISAPTLQQYYGFTADLGVRYIL